MITIRKRGITNVFTISSKHIFFDKNEPVIVEEFDGGVKLTHPTIDYSGKFYQPSKQYISSILTLRNIYLTEGTFEVTEDSDEDLLITYYEDKVEEEE